MHALRKFLFCSALLIAACVPAFAQPDALRIVVHKAARTLELHQGDVVVKTYKTGLGFSPVGPKQKRGDGKTPEGNYFICVKNPQSRFYLSLGISYPSPADAAVALTSKTITRADHDRIVSAHARKTTPPWNTPLGGEIFIHGNGSSSDWTLGCIALTDADMKDLYARIAVGTAIEIKK